MITYPTNIIDKYIIKSKTNVGNLCKQYVYLIEDESHNLTVIFHKYMMAEPDTFHFFTDLNPVKKFKGKRLYFEHFGLKLKTMIEALELINKRLDE